MANAVFITGAQMGTGYVIAETFAKQGWDVFITSRTAEKAASRNPAAGGLLPQLLHFGDHVQRCGLAQGCDQREPGV